ncbi:hypothetical protein V5799_027301 [Amblyomma americanum]|uniref:Secreted protein n=1 Tax=Amblyomma americanum TaxID=6943 RepID=A0AAQ4DG41_AMBAM
MKFAVFFLGVLCTLIVATESGYPKLTTTGQQLRKPYCPAWCPRGSKAGARCGEDCVCVQRHPSSRGLGLLPCVWSPAVSLRWPKFVP